MKVVKNPFLNQFVVYVPHRQNRPEERLNGELICPFCRGNEHLCDEEILRLPEKGEWQVRVVKNKFPIIMPHEVIIHTPEHKKFFIDIPFENARLVFKAYKIRFNFHRKKSKGKVLIYANEGEEAGASLFHSHSQLVVLDGSFKPSFPAPQPVENLVEENEYFWVYCPAFSQWPYEFWIRPKRKGFFGEIKSEELINLVFLLRKYLKQLKELHRKIHKFKIPFSYNWYIYPETPWYLRVIPRFVYHAGLELASNVVANIVSPLEASLALKGLEKDYAKVLEKLKEFEEKDS